MCGQHSELRIAATTDLRCDAFFHLQRQNKSNLRDSAHSSLVNMPTCILQPVRISGMGFALMGAVFEVFQKDNG